MTLLEVLGLLVTHLSVGTLYARANSRLCYEAAAHRWSRHGSRIVDQSYRERLVLHVVAWPVVWPVRVIGRVVTGPVGDSGTAYEMWMLMQEQVNLGRKEIER